MVKQGLAAAFVAVSVAACGSVTRGTSELIAFTSAPAGAAVATTTKDRKSVV